MMNFLNEFQVASPLDPVDKLTVNDPICGSWQDVHRPLTIATIPSGKRDDVSRKAASSSGILGLLHCFDLGRPTMRRAMHSGTERLVTFSTQTRRRMELTSFPRPSYLAPSTLRPAKASHNLRAVASHPRHFKSSRSSMSHTSRRITYQGGDHGALQVGALL